MNLKDKTNNGFNIKKFIDIDAIKAKFNPSSSSRKSPSSRPTAFGDFSTRLRQKNSKGKKNTKTAIYLRRAAIFFTLSFLFLSLFGILVALGVVSAMSRDLPDVDKYIADSKNLGTETIIYDRSGTELYRLRGDIINERVELKDVPDKLQWAFLAAEDANFKTHKGLDLFGLSRAVTCVLGNYATGKSSDGCGGGSSITQQLIKVTTSADERSIDRKIREAILAMRVEETYSKDEILESYLNIVGQGREYVGIKTGSVYIFGKSDLSQLTLAEMSYIAAFPNNPEIFSPRGSIYDPQRSQERANYVLDRMYELRDKTGVTKEEYDVAKAEVATVKFADDRVLMKAPHFVNQVLNDLDELYKDKVPEGKKGRDFLKTQGYKVYTTVDLPTQELMENTLKTRIESPEFQNKTGAQTGSGVVMDVKTGDILALVGSRDFYGPKGDLRFSPEFNAATAKRSVGSSIKPFVYGSTFEKGYNPSSIVVDIPIDQSPSAAVKVSNTPYPYNFDRGVFGAYANISTSGRGDFKPMRLGLKYSLNQPAVTAANIVGVNQFADFYVRASGNNSLRAEFKGPASALGAANVPLLDHVHAFTTIADNGNYKPMRSILRITDEGGAEIYNNSAVQNKQVIEKSVAYLVNDMNKNYFIFDTDIDTRVGPNTRTLVSNIRKTTDWAGKTGTSDTSRGPGDIVFVGYTPDVVMGMWAGNSCGYDDPACTPLKPSAESGWLYDYVYSYFLDGYKSNLKPGRFQQPAGVKRVALCNLTGNAMSDLCSAAGGTALQEIVSEISMPAAETWIEKQSVTQCGDSIKLARDIDRDLGLASDRYVVRYDKVFPQKYIADQVTKYLATAKTNPLVTEVCNIDRSLTAPQVTMNNPVNGGTYLTGEKMTISATIKSDIAIQKVDLVVGSNNTIIKSFGPSEPISFTVDLSQPPFATGSNKIQIIATNIKGAEGSDTATIQIASGTVGARFVAPNSSKQIKKTPAAQLEPLTIQLIGVTENELTSSSFVVTGTGGYTSGPIAANCINGGTSCTGSWTLPAADATKVYTIAFNAVSAKGNITATVTNIKVIP